VNSSAKGRRVLRFVAIAGTAILTLALLLGTIGTGTSIAASPNGRYFIGFRGAPDAALIRGLGGEVVHSYSIVPAIAARLPEAAVKALANNPNIAYIEPDGICQAIVDTVPWGITRVGADLVQAGGNSGLGIKVAIIDTGIDMTHPDLTVAGGATFVTGTTTPNDDNGHGTHVAGTVAALANGSGVIGCAPAAALYAVKVLDSRGSGAWTDIVAGIDWAANNGMQVINMSLGGSTGTSTLQTACDNAYAKGIVIVCAAGNSGTVDGSGENVGYPAMYSSCIAVAATDSNNLRASFSSTGVKVELAAPGVSIYSTYKGGTYATLNGTSMASPHVAGVAALVIKANSTWTNVQVRTALTATALDLGTAGRDTWYGYGLIDAVKACAYTGGTTPPPTPALTVTVTTDKTSYTMGQIVTITTTVKDAAGLAVSGATVNLSIKNPKGKTKTASGTTGTTGLFVYSYTPKSTDGKGTYTVTSTASMTGYTSATATCTFTVN
jgi:minor extracellular protease Epr